MGWKFNSEKPIYIQIVEQITTGIITGKLPLGSKVMSIRDFAQSAQVNPNTMQKAFLELQKNGLIIANRTSGNFITEDVELITSLKEKMASEIVSDFYEKMEALGYEKNEIQKHIKNFKE